MKQTGEDNVQIIGDGNTVTKGKKPFDGDYTKSDCEDHTYRYVSVKVRLFLLFLGVAPFVGSVIYKIINHIPLVSFRSEGIYSIYGWYMWAGFLFLVFLLLPFIDKRSRVQFSPKLGLIKVSGKEYLFNDMQDIDCDENILILSQKRSDDVLRIPLPRKGCRYIHKCIGRLWES